MTKEVEVKARLRNPTETMAQLARLGCVLSAPVQQVDQVYFPVDIIDPTTHTLGRNFMRIRKQGEKTLFTLKQPQLNQCDCIEKELEISDGKTMGEAIEMLGYRPFVVVDKKRSKGMCGEYEICVDEVVGLGNFIEVEIIADTDSIAAQEKMFTFLESVGVPKEDVVMEGYDVLMHKAGLTTWNNARG